MDNFGIEDLMELQAALESLRADGRELVKIGMEYEVARIVLNAITLRRDKYVPDDLAKDAARYRWLRWQGCTFYTDDAPCDINGEQKATKHHVCEWAMDDAIDAAMAVEQEANRG